MGTDMQDSIKQGRAEFRIKVVCADGHHELTVSSWFRGTGAPVPRWAEERDPNVFAGARWHEECHRQSRNTATNPPCRQWLLEDPSARLDWRRARTAPRYIVDRLRCPACGRDKQMAGGERWELFLDRLLEAGIHRVSLRDVERMVS